MWWEPLVEALVAASVKWIEPLVAAVFGTAIAWLGWLGKKALLKKQAKTAALEAEQHFGTASGLGPSKRQRANETLRRTMSGLVTTQSNRAIAIQDHGMKAVEQKKNSDPPPEQPPPN